MKKQYWYLIISTIIILFVLWLILVFSFIPSVKNSYKGHIYFGNIPLIKAKVIEENTNDSNYTFTDNAGYFELKRKDLNTINNIIIQSNNGYDTINTRRGGNAGSNFRYLFLTKNQSDTLDIQLERLLEQQVKYK